MDAETQANIDKIRAALANLHRLMFGPPEKPKRRVPKVRHAEFAAIVAQIEKTIALNVAATDALDLARDRVKTVKRSPVPPSTRH